MQDETIKTICIIFGIVLLEICAMICGIDGMLLTTVVGALAAIGGYQLKEAIVKADAKKL